MLKRLSSSFEWFLGWRFTRRGRSAQGNRFISFISAVSMLGIALGVAGLIIVLSVMNGFQKQVRDRMLSVLPHIEVFQRSTAEIDWPDLIKRVKVHPEVLGVARFASGQGLLNANGQIKGAIIKGIVPSEEPQVSQVSEQMVAGSLSELNRRRFGVVLGSRLAAALRLNMGEKVSLVVPVAQAGPVGYVPRIRVLTVVGLIDSGHFEYDSSFAWVSTLDAKALFREQTVEGLRVRLNNLHDAPAVERSLAKSLPAAAQVTNWTRQNRVWFDAVKVEKRLMGIILSIIVAVAAFNLLSSLVMTVAEKNGDIAVLLTLGATPQSILCIFVVQGAIAGLIGTGLGLLFGCAVAFQIETVVPALESFFDFYFLPPDLYYVSSVPSDPQLGDIAMITLLSVLLSLLATLYPSWRATKVNPATALRHE